MLKVFFIIAVVNVLSVFAGGGGGGGSTAGGGSIGKEFSSDKYGRVEISKKVNNIGDNVFMETFTHVRYKKFLDSYSWKNGYAQTTMYKNGKKYTVNNLKINQYLIFFIDNREPAVTSTIKKTVNLNNVNTIRLELSENYVLVATKHYANVNGTLFVKPEINNWGGPMNNNVSTFSFLNQEF